MIKNACRALKRYDWQDVEKYLDRKVMRSRFRNKHKRMRPSRKQIIRILATSKWSVPIERGDKHRRTRYKFVEDREALINESAEE
jgi:hypothetical protein